MSHARACAWNGMGWTAAAWVEARVAAVLVAARARYWCLLFLCVCFFRLSTSESLLLDEDESCSRLRSGRDGKGWIGPDGAGWDGMGRDNVSGFFVCKLWDGSSGGIGGGGDSDGGSD